MSEVGFLTGEAQNPTPNEPSITPTASTSHDSTLHDESYIQATAYNAEESEKVARADDTASQEFIGEIVDTAPSEVDRPTLQYILRAIPKYHLYQAELSLVPPPEDFEILSRYVGKAAVRDLWEMAKKEQASRHKIGYGPVKTTLVATWLQSVVALALIGAGIIAIVERLTPVAVAIFGTGIVAVGVVGYVRSRR